MRRIVVIVPGLLSLPERESYLRQTLPNLARLAEISVISKVAASPKTITPESYLFGLPPDLIRLAQGPLTVSALGFDPPEKSTHFHLSLMSYVDGLASFPKALPTYEEVELLLSLAKKLDSRFLTTCKGEGLDHGLVWESLGDLGTTRASDVEGNPIREHLPEGDADRLLRRYIDDSINLFSELEMNERRIDEGLSPFNLLWPWGQGVRHSCPNLALKRGEPVFVESSSMRLAGLTRLVGYRHGDRSVLGRGLALKLRKMATNLWSKDAAIGFVDVPLELRQMGREEELGWFIKQLDQEFIAPLLENHLKEPSRLTFVTPGPIQPTQFEQMVPSPIGLSLSAETAVPSSNIYPCDERALDERSIPLKDLWSLIEVGIVQ